mmetsp:Transcript_7705/g.11651  ORF Transcript_7705/g.11651 Transcript_7705/m.11651 type:complete len:277 (-) Transcript_7705:547-1377(-)
MHADCFVIEHLEEGLPRWALLEYSHIIHHFLNGFPNAKIVFTNVISQMHEFQESSEALACEYEHTKSTTTTHPLSITLQFTKSQVNVSATSQDALSYIESFCNLSKGSIESTVILLDPLAEKPLSARPPVTSPEFVVEKSADKCSPSMTFLVFGGILGDHPMDGRTYAELSRNFLLRENFNPTYHLEYRHLGALQMTTDTAVLVSALVYLRRMSLDSLEYVDEPKIRLSSVERVTMRGFRYLGSSNVHDQQHSEIVASALLPLGMLDLLKADYYVD